MKKILILLVLVVLLTVLFFRISFSNQYCTTESFQNDTLLVKKYTESARALVQNKPDSAIFLYNKAIFILKTYPTNDKINHLLASCYVDLSEVYLPQAKYDQAKELRTKAAKIAGINDPDIQARILTQDGLTCYYQSKYSDALKLYEKALQLAKKTSNFKLQVKLITNKAIIYYQQGNIKMAVAGFNCSLQNAKKLKDNELITDAYMNFGIVFTDQMKYQGARECYTKAIDFYSTNRQFDDLMVCYRKLGNVFYMMQNYAESIEWYQKSLQLAKEINNRFGIAKSYHNIGEVYLRIGDYVHANDYFIFSMKINESIMDKAGMANGYRSLGNLHFMQKNFSKSLFYYQKALEIDLKLQLLKDQAKDYANISLVYGEYKQFSKAIAFCQNAIRLSKKVDDLYGVAEDTRILGGFYFHQKNYAMAELNYLNAINLKKNQYDQEGMTSVYCQLSELYINKPAPVPEKNKNLYKALLYGLKAFEITKKTQNPHLISDVSNNLFTVYKKLNNFHKAFYFLELNKKTNDSIFNKSKAEALAFAEGRWNNEKKQLQIQDLQKLNKVITEQKTLEAKRHKVIVFGLILIFILLIFITLMLWLSKKKQREIRHQIQLSRISLLRLQNIRNRISPHFIFNILNREIISEENFAKHNEMIGLVKYLRRSLEITEQIAVTLAQEVDFVKNYLQMEQTSLGNNCQIKWEIDKRIAADQIKIPAMVMQIPIENALKHALRGKEGEKLLSISLALIELGVLITIQDNGDGYYPHKNSETKGTGIGLNVLFQTIQLLNSKNNQKIEFDITNLQGESTTGTKVEIKVPVQYNFEF